MDCDATIVSSTCVSESVSAATSSGSVVMEVSFAISDDAVNCVFVSGSGSVSDAITSSATMIMVTALYVSDDRDSSM